MDPTDAIGEPVIFYRKEDSLESLNKIKQKIHRELLNRLGEKLREEDEERLKARAKAVIEELIKIEDLPPGINRQLLKKEVLDEVLGYGPLEDLLADPEVSEIMVNKKEQIYFERNGKIKKSTKKFFSNKQIYAVIERIIAPLGRRIDESTPMVDARLPDGSRVNVIIPPLSLDGPIVTIRKFPAHAFGINDLIARGTLDERMSAFLQLCIRARRNIIVSGGTGSGKTTLLNVLSSFIPSEERIITIEDAAELKLTQEHVVRLETRPPNIEGKGEIAVRDLVRNSLRMRPDRIIVGEVRGEETLDMLQAMNTGHDGSLTTLHANSPRDALSRLETMVLMSGLDLPLRAIREQISSAIDLIVHQARLIDGSRKIMQIVEVAGREKETILMQDIFYFKQKGLDAQGKVIGEYLPAGNIPRFIQQCKEAGIDFPLEIFHL